MPNYPISNVTRRVVYTGSAGVGPYAFSFEILVNTDLAVYKNNSLLTLTTDYTVSINSNGTGTVTLVVAANSDDRIIIVGNRAVQRTTDFVTGGDLFANTLNDELDSQTIFVQQVSESVDRAIKAPVTDPTTINMTLPVQATRANTVLSFDANGNPESIVLKGDIANAATYASTAQAAASSASSTLAQFQGIYYGSASSDPSVDPNGAAPTAGDFYFNTSTSLLRVYTTSGWLDGVSATPATFATQTFSGNGSTTSFTLSSAPSSLAAVEAYISGVAQVPTTAYSVSGTTLTFVSAPASGTDNILVRWVGGLAVGVPNDGSVTTTKLQDSAVTAAKIQDGTITPTELSTGRPSWDSSGNVTASGNLTAQNASLVVAAAAPVLTFERGSTAMTSGDVYSRIDFKGNDSSTNAGGVRARLSHVATSTTGGSKLVFEVASGSTTTLTSRMEVGSTIAINGTTSISNLNSAIHNGEHIVSGEATLFNTDTQQDIDLTSYLPANAADSYYMHVDVVGTYLSDWAANTFGARLFKSWAQMVSWSGTAYQLNGAVLSHTAYNSDSTNFPAGAVNASKVLTVVSSSQVLLRLQNRTSPASGSGTYFKYRVRILANFI